MNLHSILLRSTGKRGAAIRTEETRLTRTEDAPTTEVDLDESPFETPAVEGLPYDRNSAEARAIREILERTERERRQVR
jgi:hypothetical protein